jgi:hypothetical protein
MRQATSSGIRLQVLTARGSHRIYTLRGDISLEFLHVAWAPDSKRVAVLSCGTPQLRIAYDIEHRQHIPFAALETQVRRSIQEQYGKAALGFETLHCPTSERLHWAFSNKYPRAVAP